MNTRLVADTVVELTRLSERRRELDDLESALIQVARYNGARWADLAAAMGVSAQAVQQRYRRVGGSCWWRSRPATDGPTDVLFDGAGRWWPVCSVSQLRPGFAMPRHQGALSLAAGEWVEIVANDVGQGIQFRSATDGSYGVHHGDPAELVAHRGSAMADDSHLAEVMRRVACALPGVDAAIMGRIVLGVGDREMRKAGDRLARLSTVAGVYLTSEGGWMPRNP